MRFQLFRLTIQHARGMMDAFIVAPDKARARAVADEMNMPPGDVTLRLDRIDQNLPEKQQLNLDGFLESAPVGPATFCEDVGWVTYETPSSKLKLYHVEVIDRSTPLVVAPSIEAAVGVFWEWASLGENPDRIFKVTEPLHTISGPDKQVLEGLLEFGPAGIVTWSEEDGWARR